MTGWACALYLENGHFQMGRGLGCPKAAGGEAVFNTGMTGYQEIYTDPSYYQQIVVLTGSHVGNTGVNPDDVESSKVYLSAVVVRDYTDTSSHWRRTRSLSNYLEAASVIGISDIDTRELTRVLRDEGAQRGVVFPSDKMMIGEALAKGRELVSGTPNMQGLELVSRVSCKDPYDYGSGQGPLVLVYDFGVKTNILRHLSRRGLKIRVVPFNYPHEEVTKERPEALVLSNGPGDPAAVAGSVEQIQNVLGRYPILAICMGHQLVARALGCLTYKLKFGHHGINHPVQDLVSGRVLVTSQNHGFAVNASDLSKIGVTVSHRSLNDGCVEGFLSEKLRLMSVQFHPEASPGPSDASTIFDQFVKGFLK